ncbi:hypothetical protein BJV77DRAFT_472682 [Russula vinacea]|jgi:hypothetical protein|nr:hypothetical protein BJV77DRAFT_472682 [Russula vinacea]
MASPIDLEAILYDHSLPPLPSRLSHLPAPSAPLMRTDSSTSALNPFLVHRPTGVPPLSWDLCTSARSILFPTLSSGPGPDGVLPPAVPMASLDYAQPATWPPCGAFRIGAIGGRASVWRWPVEARNPAGVRCGDVFRALVANLHQFVLAEELAEMHPDQVALVKAAYRTRVRAGLPPSTGTATSAAMDDGIRRVDCLLGHTQFFGLVPGPSPGEWTMYVGVA